MAATPRSRRFGAFEVVLVMTIIGLASYVGVSLFSEGPAVAGSDCTSSLEPPTTLTLEEVYGVPRRDIAPGTYEVVPAGDQGTEVLLFLRKPDADSRVWCQSLPTSTFIVKGYLRTTPDGILEIIEDRDFKIAIFHQRDP